MTADNLMDYIDDLAFDLSSQKPNRPGFYQKDGVGYLVRWNKAGTYLYAERFDGTRFAYESGAMSKLTAGHYITLAQASAMSMQIGKCVCCRRRLTVKESVERGIGPVCRKKYYGMA
jgi:hypothetical protein